MPVSSKCQYSLCPAHGRGGDRPSRRHFYPGSTMTDGQWALLAPLLPAVGSSGGRGGQAREVGSAPGPGRDLLPGPRPLPAYATQPVMLPPLGSAS